MRLAFQTYERDNVVTFSDLLPTPQKIRIYPTDARDAGLRVLLQGRDANQQTILTTDPSTGLSAPGEYVALAFPFAESANLYSKIEGVEKDQTFGPIQLFQVDPNTGSELPLSTMDGNESAANYRRYLVGGIPNANLCCPSPGNPITITAMARLDFIPVQNETDYLLIQCVPALIEEAQSIRFSRMENGAQQSAIHHARALALLCGQLDHYEGKVNTAIRVPLFGYNKLRASFR